MRRGIIDVSVTYIDEGRGRKLPYTRTREISSHAHEVGMGGITRKPVTRWGRRRKSPHART